MSSSGSVDVVLFEPAAAAARNGDNERYYLARFVDQNILDVALPKTCADCLRDCPGARRTG